MTESGITKELFSFSETFATDLSGCFVLFESSCRANVNADSTSWHAKRDDIPAPHDDKQDVEDTTLESLKPLTNVMNDDSVGKAAERLAAKKGEQVHMAEPPTKVTDAV